LRQTKMASLPQPAKMTNATCTLIALALTLPWTRIRWQGGGCAVTRLVHYCHGCCHWRHLCLHSWDYGTMDNGCGTRQCRHANIRGREEVGHHDPSAWSNKNKKQKQINNSDGNVTASVPAASYAHAATAAASA
jgi:hypothetical protein